MGRAMTLVNGRVAGALVLAVLAIAGCTAPPAPSIERARATALPAPAAAQRAAGTLGRLGFHLEEAGTTSIEARRPTGAAEAWARCDGIWVDDNYSLAKRSDFARPQARGADVRVDAVDAAAGSRVSVSTSFDASYRDRFRNFGFRAPCASTGVLERLLLDAVTAP